MLLLFMLGMGECSEPPVPPPPPAPPPDVAPTQHPPVHCAAVVLPEKAEPTSVLRLAIGSGPSQEVGPIAGTCAATQEAGALCAVRCGTGPEAQVLKAGWEGARLAVWTRPADQPDAWTRLWVATGPVVHP